MAIKFGRRFSPSKGDIQFGTVTSQENSLVSLAVRLDAFLLPLLLLGCTAGSLFTFLTAYPIRFFSDALWGVLFLSAVCFGTLYQIRRLKWFILPLTAILLSFFCYYFRKELLEGIQSGGYELFAFLNDSGYNVGNPFSQSSAIFQCTLLLCVFAVLFTALIGFFVCAFPCVPAVLLLTLPLEILVFWYLFEPAFWSVFLYFLSITGLLATRIFYRKRIVKKQKQKVFRPFGKTSPAVVTICLFFALLIGLGQASWDLFSLERPKRFDQYAQQIREFDYKAFFNNLLFNPFPIGRDEGVLPRGNLVYDYHTDLIVTMPYPSQNVYLRGFSGAGYQNGRWIEIPDEEYQNAPWYQQLRETGFSYFDLAARYDNYGELLLMEVDSVDGGTKYAFTPEGVLAGSDILAQYDRSFRPKGRRYIVPYITSSYREESIPDAITYSSSLSTLEYDILEKYGDFVNSYYTGNYLEGLDEIENEIWLNTEETVAAEQREYEESIREWNENNEEQIPLDPYQYDQNSFFYHLAEQVKRYLKENYQYTLSPGETPEGEDPVSYFLLENKQGYCVHFASAAALLLQDMGVPCRYVEGYLIRTENLIDAKTELETLQTTCPQINEYTAQREDMDYTITTDYTTVEIDDSGAHAWVEYYAYGRWNILEVTPGYAENELAVLPPSTESSQTEESQPESSQEISSEEESSEVSSLEESSEESTEGNARFPVAVLLWIALPVLFLLLLIGRKEFLERRRKERFSVQDRKTAVLAQYSYLTAFLRKTGYQRASQICYHPEEFRQAYPCFSENYYKECMDIVLHAAFSKAAVSEEDYQLFSSFVQGFVQKQKEGMSKLRRLVVTYLLGL